MAIKVSKKHRATAKKSKAKIAAKKVTTPKVKVKKKTPVKAKRSKKRPVISKVLTKKISKLLALEDKMSTNIASNTKEVTSSKFDLGVQEKPIHREYNLPFEYGENMLALLTVDPGLVFVYWEVTQDKMNEAFSFIGNNSKLTLRFFEGTSNWDVEIYERVGNWYLRIPKSGKTLYVEIGMKNDRGHFFRISSSNCVLLPPRGLAKPGPIKWMIVSPDGEKRITEIEEYTDADMELLRKILGPHFFDLLQRGRFTRIVGSSMEHVFMDIEGLRPSDLSSSSSGSVG